MRMSWTEWNEKVRLNLRMIDMPMRHLDTLYAWYEQGLSLQSATVAMRKILEQDQVKE